MSPPVLQVAETPAGFDRRPLRVVDCSAVAGLVFREAWFDSACALIENASLHAPDLIRHELTNVALKKHRRGESHALIGLEFALSLAIDLHAADTPAVFVLAERYQVSAYDAAYLWLAAELRCPLVTFDERLAAAARSHLANLT